MPFLDFFYNNGWMMVVAISFLFGWMSADVIMYRKEKKRNVSN